MFFNSLMGMTSSVADIICITQITFKLIYNTLPANDGWFSLQNSKLLANFGTFVIKCISKRFLLRIMFLRYQPGFRTVRARIALALSFLA